MENAGQGVSPMVLIVDDDELALARLKQLVVETGYAVQTTTSGAAALTSLDTSSASIVITDLHMPVMDGLDLCRRIRERTWPGYVYVMLLTIQDEEEHIQAGLVAGADDYVSKRAYATQFKARLRAAKRFLTLEGPGNQARGKRRQTTTTDVVTGVYDRTYLMKNLGLELQRSLMGSNDVSLLLFEFEHFDLIKTMYGHGVSDTVLAGLIRQIIQCLDSATAWCAHLGGEEFAVVMEDTTLADAESCAAQVRRAIAEGSISAFAGTVQINLRIGFSGIVESVEGNTIRVESLLAVASKDLYTRKRAGRNRPADSRLEQARGRSAGKNALVRSSSRVIEPSPPSRH